MRFDDNGFSIVPDLEGPVGILDLGNNLVSLLNITELIGDLGSVHPHDSIFLPLLGNPVSSVTGINFNESFFFFFWSQLLITQWPDASHNLYAQNDCRRWSWYPRRPTCQRTIQWRLRAVQHITSKTRWFENEGGVAKLARERSEESRVWK